jgi:hypothetical protein
MRLAITASWLALTIIGGSLVAVRAADDSPTAKGAEPSSLGGAAAEIDRLVGQLDAPRYSERQAASDKLAALGVAALPALEKAAKAESLEVATRAIALLKGLLDSSEASTREDARHALQRLAKGDRPKASRLAEEAIKAKEQEDAANAQQAAQFANRQQVGPIQVAPGISAERVRVQINNGRREINIDEPDRKIKISDGKGQPIKIEVTSKTNGKDSTEKYEAKDVEELKKKHPEAHKFYRGWENQGNPLGFPQGIPFNAVQIHLPPDQQVRMAIAVLQALHQHVDVLSKGDQVQKATPQARADLKQAIDQFKQTLAEVEKRLQEKPETHAAKPDPNRGTNKTQ